jgi:hypothetical protein
MAGSEPLRVTVVTPEKVIVLAALFAALEAMIAALKVPGWPVPSWKRTPS